MAPLETSFRSPRFWIIRFVLESKKRVAFTGIFFHVSLSGWGLFWAHWLEPDYQDTVPDWHLGGVPGPEVPGPPWSLQTLSFLARIGVSASLHSYEYSGLEFWVFLGMLPTPSKFFGSRQEWGKLWHRMLYFSNAGFICSLISEAPSRVWPFWLPRPIIILEFLTGAEITLLGWKSNSPQAQVWKP